MTTLADKAILSGTNNRPPMLEKDMYDSWKSRMELYMMNRQLRRMILKSVENGPLLWPSIEENRVTRPKKYSELSAMEAIQADCNVVISHETLVARSLQQNSFIERRNCMLIEAARTMLIYAQALLFLWTEAVATTCYTQNRSIVRLHDGLALHEMTPATISSGLMPKPTYSTPFVPPSRNDWDMLFQLLFDELLTPSPSVDPLAPKVIALIAAVIAPELVET
nr:putative ribonuclease H-like domain-containing protein [Tanacetum cinerariifolium]